VVITRATTQGRHWIRDLVQYINHTCSTDAYLHKQKMEKSILKQPQQVIQNNIVKVQL